MKKKIKSAAVLTIFGVSEMTPSGRKAVLNWLRRQIKDIEKYHKVPGYAKRYTARYLYK